MKEGGKKTQKRFISRGEKGRWTDRANYENEQKVYCQGWTINNGGVTTVH